MTTRTATKSKRTTAAERRAESEAAATLEVLMMRHDVRTRHDGTPDGLACQECGHLAPCFTNRAVKYAIEQLAVLE